MISESQAPQFIASDIDGTLLDPNHRVSKRNREVIHRAVDSGCHFALSTGRPFRWVEPVVEQLELAPLCVTSNGAVLYDAAADKVVHSHQLAPETLDYVARTAVELFAPHGGVGIGAERCGNSSKDPIDELFVVEEVYSKSDIFQEGFGMGTLEDVVAVPAVKLVLRHPTMRSAQMFELLSPAIDPASAHVTYSIDHGLLEVAPPGVTKAGGVEWLAQRYGVEREDVIAFGDMPNDIEMLQWVGMGVAMGNAAESVKEAADLITAPNHQAGLAKILEQWF